MTKAFYFSFHSSTTLLYYKDNNYEQKYIFNFALHQQTEGDGPVVDAAAGVADLTAAGHDKVGLPATGKAAAAQKIGKDVRNLPAVGRRDEHPRPVGVQRGRRVIFDRFIRGDEIDTNTIRAQQWEKGISCLVLVFHHQLQRFGQEFHPGKCSGLLAYTEMLAYKNR